ncbi:unnamed protein product [Mytilus coruscus]|uniref:Reverse transcriptase zinc-binding domain-containing protein n=1 Tax=Mytilus coruscus TaxID=42192 RepID=A0A6J8ELV7_MYTCO|nr:unnamed protein product [Mytilus coruscus]
MKYWSTKIVQMSMLYLGLKYLRNQNLIKGKLHPILKHKSHSALDNSRIPTRLRLITGTYVLQTKRIQFYRQETDPTCLLCGLQEETLEHFVMQCEKLQSVRTVILKEVNDIWQNEMNNTTRFHDLNITTQMQMLLDSAKLINLNKYNSASAARLENHSRNLFFELHIKRNVLLDEKTLRHSVEDKLAWRGGGVGRPLTLGHKAPACLQIPSEHTFRFYRTYTFITI